MYRVVLHEADVAGNQTTQQTYLTVDNTPPTATVTLTAKDGWSYVSAPDTIWFNPNVASAFHFHLAGDDHGGIGVSGLITPGMGTGWSPALNGENPGTSVDRDFGWGVGAPAPGQRTASAVDQFQDQGTATFSVLSDGAGPTGGSATAGPSGTVVDLDLTAPTDSQSGLSEDPVEVDRASGPDCGSLSDYAPVDSIEPSRTSWSDGSVIGGECYQYQLLYRDNVGNSTAVTSNAIVAPM
jgi:hypothetical protein